jgi:predicted RNA-binding protein YlqC (UPF0109 family)
MKELIRHIVSHLVDHPDQIQVDEIDGERTSVIELRVAKEDLGKVIGKEGRIAKAMRVLISASSSKDRKKSVLEIIE